VKILIVEDEMLLAQSVKELLETKGFSADAVGDGENGLAYAETGVYDLIILDVMLPKMSGFALARQLRRQHIGTPILMLTARSELEDRVDGLNAGADYYLTKPFENAELLACVHALLRRQGSQIDELSCGRTTLSLDTGVLACGGEHIRLSAREFDVMRMLMQSPDRNISKEALLERVWGYDSSATENSVEVYIGFLRKKLSRIGSDVRIVAVRRMGYHLEAES